ncbi:DUF4177 domain-containing protein [Paenibacillus harenae]|uniref:DUF4177 domain-containing protein n=1 Tax=Paenibacillus harenae TaxID=306543 RepID=UPI00316AD744
MNGGAKLVRVHICRDLIRWILLIRTHRNTIDEHAKDGWRIVQVLPTHCIGHGKPTDYEIIFESKRQRDGGGTILFVHIMKSPELTGRPFFS